ncbi:hypothetical protein XELAEV_18023534mg [Xenopus laevis]|uniref:Uncharacterized protein n=1 Tax=Xenopus laevis TaxID=8355 RepID=A0A974HP62_XENLA|nr:hypothetical protein XELAEV_18023534mg [Xenopus laevis]
MSSSQDLWPGNLSPGMEISHSPILLPFFGYTVWRSARLHMSAIISINMHPLLGFYCTDVSCIASSHALHSFHFFRMTFHCLKQHLY